MGYWLPLTVPCVHSTQVLHCCYRAQCTGGALLLQRRVNVWGVRGCIISLAVCLLFLVTSGWTQRVRIAAQVGEGSVQALRHKWVYAAPWHTSVHSVHSSRHTSVRSVHTSRHKRTGRLTQTFTMVSPTPAYGYQQQHTNKTQHEHTQNTRYATCSVSKTRTYTPRVRNRHHVHAQCP